MSIDNTLFLTVTIVCGGVYLIKNANIINYAIRYSLGERSVYGRFKYVDWFPKSFYLAP